MASCFALNATSNTTLDNAKTAKVKQGKTTLASAMMDARIVAAPIVFTTTVGTVNA